MLDAAALAQRHTEFFKAILTQQRQVAHFDAITGEELYKHCEPKPMKKCY